MDQFSFVGNSEIDSIEELYGKYINDPESVDKSFYDFFKGFDFALKHFNDHNCKIMDKEFRVINLIHGYRQRGHLFTKTNPVRTRRRYFPTLDIENFDLSKNDLKTIFHAGNELGIGPASLEDIINHVSETYCESVGVEYLYIRKPEVVAWLKNKMETIKNKPLYSVEKKIQIYHQLKQAVGFEAFVHKKFIGQKRFSLEGSEVIIPALRFMFEKGAQLGVKEFAIGMAHRGRLNILANIMGKPFENIFKEFEGNEYENGISLGDVKYHLGYENDIKTELGEDVKLVLAPNPSHLETVSPVIEGIARSHIENDFDGDFEKVVPVVIHGDAAIAGQGVVYEVVQMSQLPGYKTGGTIHLVVNNQIGFTTNYLDARSSTYCTDVAKVTRSPVFHVNGDDAEAMVYVMELAIEYRQKYQADVFIDVLSYRKYGHNEGDEPRFTQPTLYKAIANHPNPLEIYARKLYDQGFLTIVKDIAYQSEFEKLLEDKYTISKEFNKVKVIRFLEQAWYGYRYSTNDDFFESPFTGVPKETLFHLAKKLCELPNDKDFFKKVHKIVEDRLKLIEEEKIDWAMAELLAYATLLSSGVKVRLSGQDAQRGTFAHRHAAFTIEDMNEKYIPLQHLSSNQAEFSVYNSPLSEYGVLGFEYGYALASPRWLTIWEAQFGDFTNVAQVIIDQYISSAEEKWGLMNGLVLLLPHGFEGQGPEHSSARMERFLNLAVQNNMQIVNVTTPANFFHLLRRQVNRDIRVPLIVFSPKSLLRHPQCISKLDSLVIGRFEEVIDDGDVNVKEVKRVVFCTGKIYYDLVAQKMELNATDVALVRIEQLHPFPLKKVEALIEKYNKALLHLWVQEEPENMGAWYYIRTQMNQWSIVPVARLASASPATGLQKLHTIGQNEIIAKVFKSCHCDLKLKYCGLQCVEGKSREDILKQHKYFVETPRFSI
ncbi:MAG: 2-oxoglutarate dehydrogenase E1 component [Marinilabiliaceae bacterium]|nr:2-oxoglutarate dehydrogenase E1 component [Marinilabiliaceae bacterium]